MKTRFTTLTNDINDIRKNFKSVSAERLDQMIDGLAHDFQKSRYPLIWRDAHLLSGISSKQSLAYGLTNDYAAQSNIAHGNLDSFTKQLSRMHLTATPQQARHNMKLIDDDLAYLGHSSLHWFSINANGRVTSAGMKNVEQLLARLQRGLSHVNTRVTAK